MARVSTYLNFPRETEAAFEFYRSVFRTEFDGPIHRFSEVPQQPGQPGRQVKPHAVLPLAYRDPGYRNSAHRAWIGGADFHQPVDHPGGADWWEVGGKVVDGHSLQPGQRFALGFRLWRFPGARLGRCAEPSQLPGVKAQLSAELFVKFAQSLM